MHFGYGFQALERGISFFTEADAYQLLLRFQSKVIGHLMVDVIARPAVRLFRLLGTAGTIEWDQGKRTAAPEARFAAERSALDRAPRRGRAPGSSERPGCRHHRRRADT